MIMPLTIDNKLVEQYRERVATAKNIAIMAHMNPDGDAVGSILGLSCAVRQHATKALSLTTILPNVVPDTFRFLPGSDLIIDADHAPELCKQAIASADLIICVDLNTTPRVGSLQLDLEQATAFKVLVDHHVGPDLQQFQLVISFPEISSTCELLFWLISQSWGLDSLNLDIARPLYCGICTDTGSFAYSCESPTLYEAVGHLMQFPIGGADIHNRIFNTFSVARMRLLGFCISERLRIFEDEKFAYFYLSNDDQKRFHVNAGDLEVIVNYTLMMKNVEVGAFVKELDNGSVRISLRSKYDFDVRLFASTYFTGGGHVKAAGATSPFDFPTTVQKLEEYLRKEMNR